MQFNFLKYLFSKFIQKRHSWKSVVNGRKPQIFIPEPDQEIIKIIWPSMENGPWIAGGACIKWLQNPNKSIAGVTDIDIYCRNERQIKLIEKRLLSSCVKGYESKNAMSFIKKLSFNDTEYMYTIQIIKINVGNSAKEIVDTFDIEACRIATDGVEIYASQQTLEDIHNKVIRLNAIQPDSVRRILKYLIKGFSLDPETYKRLGSTSDVKWDFDYSTEDY